MRKGRRPHQQGQPLFAARRLPTMTVPLAAAAVAWGRRADANPHRLTRALRRRADLVWHRGTAVRCPLCHGRWDRFKDAWNRPDALCWRCGAHERHRAEWLVLQERGELLRSVTSLLHFAPEYCLRPRLEDAAARDGFRYVTADLDPAG